MLWVLPPLCGGVPEPRPRTIPAMRVNVIGTTGAGKTAFAARLAAALGADHIELDALHWEPGWTPADRDAFRGRVADALSGDAWVTCGNYRAVRDIVWSRADTVVFLDYPLPLMFGRLLRRTARRVVSRERVWGHSTETVRDVFARDSIFVWQLKTFRAKRRHYREALADPRWAHIEFVRFRRPHEADAWLSIHSPA